MDLLEPDWNQPKPEFLDVRKLIASIEIFPVDIKSPLLLEFLARLRESHGNGGAHLFCFDVGPSEVYDWFTSRNRWSFDGHIDELLEHPTILSELKLIGAASPLKTGLAQETSFLLDGRLAALLYSGGAYSSSRGDGRGEKEFAVRVCDEIFGLRYGEITCDVSFAAWTSWFHGIAWDLTMVIFDKKLRRIWLLAVTDTD